MTIAPERPATRPPLRSRASSPMWVLVRVADGDVYLDPVTRDFRLFGAPTVVTATIYDLGDLGQNGYVSLDRDGIVHVTDEGRAWLAALRRTRPAADLADDDEHKPTYGYCGGGRSAHIVTAIGDKTIGLCGMSVDFIPTVQPTNPPMCRRCAAADNASGQVAA